MWNSRLEAASLLFVNAFWAVCVTYAFCYFFKVILENNGGWSGLVPLARRSVTRFWANSETEWQDGALSWCVLFFGEAVRAWTVWAWRWFASGHLKLWLLGAAVAVAAMGVLCVVRVYGTQDVNNRRTSIMLAVAFIFGVCSVLTGGLL